MGSPSRCCFSTRAWSICNNFWYSEMDLLTNYMVNLFQTLFIFGIQQLNLQEFEGEDETMLKNGTMFLMLLKMQISFSIKVNYHGNFNAEIFENLFSTLCKTLYEKYGPVNIHMDGASYHKR